MKSAFSWLRMAVAKEGRYYIDAIHVDEKYLVATDGHRLFMVENTTGIPAMDLRVDDLENAKEVKFPRYAAVVPKRGKWYAISDIREFRAIVDGSIAYKATVYRKGTPAVFFRPVLARDKNGAFVYGDPIWFNARYIRDALAGMNFNETIYIRATKSQNEAITISQGRRLAVQMPMKGDDESERIKFDLTRTLTLDAEKPEVDPEPEPK